MFSVQGQKSDYEAFLLLKEWNIALPKYFKSSPAKDKGIFLREPPFLPHAFQLRGEKIKGTPAFRNNKFFIPDI
jgi:hypothetical protein